VLSSIFAPLLGSQTICFSTSWQAYFSSNCLCYLLILLVGVFFIVWLPKSGAKIEDSTQWLKSNISKKIINYGDIWLYVWMGTCNLTSKNKKYIS
jgi:hypothetical protein